MRKYRVDLINTVVGTMQHHVMADGYLTAKTAAEEWANSHSDHKKYGKWTAFSVEVSA